MSKKKNEPSAVEKAKEKSRLLRGEINETLADKDAPAFGKDDIQILKFHGVYQQDNRDTRLERKKAGETPDYSFMVRVAIPGGAVTAEQYLGMDDIATEYGSGAMRVTTRQGIQYHGVIKDDLKSTVAAINDKMLTTLAACGDVERNVMAPPAPFADGPHAIMREWSAQIAKALQPKSRAYHEIWIDGEKQETPRPTQDANDSEPFYGGNYLPRKFKTGVALAEVNSVDVYSYDCGLVCFVDDGAISGVNLFVGGGMGMNHKRADTFVRIAEPLGYIAPENAVEAVRTVAAIFRDNGNRADRRHARLKYLLAEWGIDRFRDEFKCRVDFELKPPRDSARPRFDDYLGAHDQGDGKHFYGVPIENGRIKDTDDRRLKTALRTIVERFNPGVNFTAQQNLLLTDLAADDIPAIEKTLADHGVPTASTLSLARRYAMACPALPTCGLAITEAERALPDVITNFEAALEEMGLDQRPISIRMTGCPNGCARPYNADIGLVGRKPGSYCIFLGGGLEGDRITDMYAEDIPPEDLVPTLTPLFRAWAKEGAENESLSDFYQRKLGRTELRKQITGDETPTISQLSLNAV